MTVALIIAVCVVTSAVGDVFVTKGMKEVGDPATLRIRALLRFGGRTMSNRWFLVGLALMAVSYLAFLRALGQADLSLVLPATSINFVLSALGARLYLRERITPLRWAGIGLICAGVALVSL